MPIYDVENRFSYYKNYSDNILIGPPKPKMGDTTWHRVVSGSIVSGSEEWKGASLASNFAYQRTNPFYKSGEVRYLRIISAKQQFEDSIVPDIVSLHLTGTYGRGGGVFWGNFVTGPDALLLLFATSSFPAVTGSDTNAVSNYEWVTSYPFEKKYGYVPRQRGGGIYQGNVPYVYTSGVPNIFQAQPAFRKIDRRYIILGNAYMDIAAPYTKSLDLVLDSNGFYDPGYSPLFPSYPTDWHPTPTNFSLFGSADGLDGSKLVYGIKSTGADKKYAGLDGDDFNYAYSASWSVGCEGWKYGLYNGIPTNFSCVFRQNHYGQPRDMLEGRPYTKTYNNALIGGPLDEAGGINFISGSALRGESDNWLTASIYQSKNVAAAYVVNPYGSGIFDKEYRASQPWFDNDPRLGT